MGHLINLMDFEYFFIEQKLLTLFKRKYFVLIMVDIHYDLFSYLIEIVYFGVLNGEYAFLDILEHFEVLLLNNGACFQILINPQCFKLKFLLGVGYHLQDGKHARRCEQSGQTGVDDSQYIPIKYFIVEANVSLTEEKGNELQYLKLEVALVFEKSLQCNIEHNQIRYVHFIQGLDA